MFHIGPEGPSTSNPEEAMAKADRYLWLSFWAAVLTAIGSVVGLFHAMISAPSGLYTAGSVPPDLSAMEAARLWSLMSVTGFVVAGVVLPILFVRQRRGISLAPGFPLD